MATTTEKQYTKCGERKPHKRIYMKRVHIKTQANRTITTWLERHELNPQKWEGQK